MTDFVTGLLFTRFASNSQFFTPRKVYNIVFCSGTVFPIRKHAKIKLEVLAVVSHIEHFFGLLHVQPLGPEKRFIRTKIHEDLLNAIVLLLHLTRRDERNPLISLLYTRELCRIRRVKASDGAFTTFLNGMSSEHNLYSSTVEAT